MKAFEMISVSDLLEDKYDAGKNDFRTLTVISSLNYEVCEEKKGEESLCDNSKVKVIYVPYAICIWSTVSNVEFFKQIMSEMYKIMLYENQNLLDEVVRNYKNCELLHLMIFLSNIVKPPPFVKMNLKLRFSSLEYITDSVYEVPCAESHIKVLFESLELSTIIKLWCSILTEKHIIILANQNFLLYSICEALLSLIFPFKWLHTYIPVLPYEQMDYLESPTPYIMGVLSSYTDLEFLKESLPNHIICDVNTSIIYGNAYCCLPVKEESKLRKKINHAKNPHLYYLEEVDSIDSPPSLTIEDVSFNRSFSSNVQHIFFRIFRNSLHNVKTKYLASEVFNYQQFLEDFYDDSLRDFWEKIINTAAFEFFILNFQHLDFSNTTLFNNICKCPEIKLENILTKNDIYSFNIRLPFNMDTIFMQIKYNQKKKENIKSTLSQLKKSYSDVLSNFQNEQRNTMFSQNLFKSLKKSFKCPENARKRRTNNFSYDFVNVKNKPVNPIIQLRDLSENIKMVRKSSFKETKKIFGGINSTYSLITNNLSLSREAFSLNKKRKNNKKFSIYGENGFIAFAKDLIDYEAENYIEHGYHAEIIKVAMKHTPANKNLMDLKITEFSKIEETENENDFDYFSSSSKGSPVMKYLNNLQNLDIIEFPKYDSYQFYLLMAFYLDDYSLENEFILEFYKKAYLNDSKSFPRIRFLQYLCNLSLEENKNILNTELGDYSLLKKITLSRIDTLEKSRKKAHSLSKHINKKKYTEVLIENSLMNSRSVSLTSSSEEEEECNEEKEESVVVIQPPKAEDENDKSPMITRKFTMKTNTKYSSNYKNSSKNLNCHVCPEAKFRSSFFVGENFDSKVDAQKIIESLKLLDQSKKSFGKYVINSFAYTPNKCINDPIRISEDIAVKIFSIILKNSLNKLKPEMITPNLLSEIANSPEFIVTKNLVGELQKVDLNIMTNDNTKTCFWLNIYNFLCIFTIIYKKEVLTNYYEWYGFLTKSYFNIGGFELSLYEIENCILQSQVVSRNNYGDVHLFEDEDKRKVLLIENPSKYTCYGISLPNNSCPGLKIYFPNNLDDLLRLNAGEFFTKFVTVDLEENEFSVPEFLNWVDNNFIDNIGQYEEFLSLEFIEFIISKKEELNKNIIKYTWSFNLSNIV